MLPGTTFISFQINCELTYAVLHLGVFCVLHNINCLHKLHSAQAEHLLLACGKAEWAFPLHLLVCVASTLPAFALLLSSACSMDGAFGPSWLPLLSKQKVHQTHKGAELFPQVSLVQSNCEITRF